jgi:hypothetical protein
MKIYREMIVHWVNEIWYSDTEIKKESIFNSFKKSGITLKLDGSKDDMIDVVYEDEKEFINPLSSSGDGVYIITFPYFGAGAPAQGELKGLISKNGKCFNNKVFNF